MSGRAVRPVALIVAGALVLAACGGGGSEDEPGATDAPSASDATAPSDSSDPSDATDGPAATAAKLDVPPLLADGIVSEDALAVVLAPDGSLDAGVLTAFAAEFAALPLEEQLSVAADLSLRTEAEAARISGLEAAIGDADATVAALDGAWSQANAAADAARAGVVVEPSGWRRAAPGPSGAAVAATGLFMGYMGLATFGKVVTEQTNTMAAGDTAVTDKPGTVYGASVDEVSAELTFKGTQDGVDVEFVAGTAIHPCPAADGSFTIDALIDVKASKGGVGQNARMELKVTGTVGDDAELASKNIENRTQWSDFGGGKGQFIDFTLSGPDGVGTTTMNRQGGVVTDSFAQVAAVMSTLVGLLIATQLLEATEQAWKSGRCVQLKVTPSAGPEGLTPSQVVQVLAEPRSKVDGAPTGGNVTATLSAGGASVEPNGSPVPADADSTYTAPGEQDKTGTVSYESRSRRGVGTASITFSTSKPAAYLVVGGLDDWQVNMVVCDITKPFTLESPGIGVAQFSGGLSGDYSATGIFNLQYSGTYQITLENGLGSPGSMVATSGGTTGDAAGFGSENYVLTPATC